MNLDRSEIREGKKKEIIIGISLRNSILVFFYGAEDPLNRSC